MQYILIYLFLGVIYAYIQRKRTEKIIIKVTEKNFYSRIIMDETIKSVSKQTWFKILIHIIVIIGWLIFLIKKIIRRFKDES